MLSMPRWALVRKPRLKLGHLEGGTCPFHQFVGAAVVGIDQAAQFVRQGQDGQAGGRGDVAQDHVHLVFQDELAAEFNLGVHAAGFVLAHEFDLSAQDAALFIDLFGQHFISVVPRDTERGGGGAG